MIKSAVIFPLLALILNSNISWHAQPHNITVQSKYQPNTQVILGSIKGDKFTPIDTTQPFSSTIQFNLPSNTTTGIYRIIFGQTTYAKVMNQPTQQLDFIYNNENINLTTDFKNPEDSLKVIQSIENKVWYRFKKQLERFDKEIMWEEKELDYVRTTAKSFETAKRIEQFNKLQKQRDSLITTYSNNNPNLYASQLIKAYHEPFRDGNLDKLQRDSVFNADYFNKLDFSNESLMNSDVYTKKVFKYLMSYAQRGLSREQQEKEFQNAIDIIIAHTKQNEKVYEFILDYLVSGFEKLRMDNLITYIADKYSGTTCQTDEITTFERKLLQQKMRVGTVVPDFTLNDINGDSVWLQEVLKEKTLVIFWASWCPHCNEMLPNIKQWQKQNPDVEIVAISLDKSKEEWTKKVFELGLESWYNLSDLKEWEGETTKDYNIYATPTLFVVDNERRILSKPYSIKELVNSTLLK